MRDVDNSDEYELVSKEELDELRKDVDGIKNNPFGSTKEGETLLEAITTLNTSINKFISILEDAEKDIIEEYQNSKPAEKLNQVLDQNEKIARALVSINDNVQKAIPAMQPQLNQQMPQNQQSQQIPAPMTTMQQPQFAPQSQMQFSQQPMQQKAMNQQMQFNQPKQMTGAPISQNMPQMNELPSLDNLPLPPLDGSGLPPLDGNLPNFNPQPPKRRGLFG